MTDAGNKLVFNQTGFVYLITSNGSVIRNVLGNGVSTQELYHRLTLDYDGVLRYYVYPKKNDTTSSSGWARRWNTLQFQPSDVCKLNAKIGSGACGFNSYCELEGAENPVCKCPPGFVFLDSNDVYRGCVQNFAPQDCRLQQNEKDAFDLAVMHKANFADGDYEFLVSYTEDMCREACLSDCRCAVAVYDGNCWKKRLPLSNGRLDAGSSNKAFFKVRRSNSNYSSSGLIPDKADKSSLTVVVTVLLATSALVILLLLSATTFLLVSRQKNNKNRGSERVTSDPRNDSLSVNLRNFSYSELELATGKFNEVLGRGASGTVYKGVLKDEQNLVAVKRLDKLVSETQDHEFRTEVKVIGGTNHKNLVKLVGFCNEGENRILVYEFMSNGSLANLLFGDCCKPGWYMRMEIAYAVARGLVYLHDECSNQIIHCDIKPQNILLDESMTAKISDFGLAKLLMANQTRTMTGIRGTKGYVAPMANFFFSLLFIWFPLLTTIDSQPVVDSRNITLGSSLTTASKDYWLSSSGDFAFGFQRVVENSDDSGEFLLAIWFDRIPQRTVVWSANRNNLVPSGSTVKLTKDGSLILADPSGKQVWNANAIGGSGVSYGELLNTGNLILADRNSVALWGSFDQPVDTMLPSQTLKKGVELVSKYSATNYSTGRFKLTMQNDGNLVFYTVFYPQLRSNFAYWATGTVATAGNAVVFNRTGSLLLIATNGTILNTLFNNRESTKNFYHRVTIDHDGVLRQYIYPKSTTNSSNWPMEWTALDSEPTNICTEIVGDTGSGACGFNSYCQMEDGRLPQCNCPQGYVYQDPSDRSKGCVKNFVSQNCLLDENGEFDLVEMINTDFPHGDYKFLSSISEDACREACLSDCLCDAVTFNGGSCWAKRSPLANGNADPINGGKTLIKVRRENSTAASDLTRRRKDRSMDLIVTAGWVLLGGSVFVNLLFLFASCPWRKKNQRFIRQVRDHRHDGGGGGTNLMSFDYKEMELATGGFKQILGSGSSGTVYKGVLNQSTNSERLVAVKVLDKMPEKKNGQNDSRLFTTEMKLISGTNHKSLVKLVGFCNEGEHCLLVYEFMSNGSLADSLFTTTRPTIDWYTRTQIAYSVARGLVYLHEECSTQIIHCDIKPQNILLDGAMTARISDFGLSKLMKPDQTKTMTAIRGTKGYLAPEWFRNVPITAKVDVHSFGIVLLELVCCRKNCMMEVENEAEMVLVDWAYECYSNGKLYKLVEKDETAMADIARVERFVKVAMWCIQEDPCLRPGMKKVALMLEGAVGVSEPPDPNSFIGAV
ncbi:G-type lectin S-receptor-like serine/threonine-protein kinase LECRK2 [Linum grandiflorum]